MKTACSNPYAASSTQVREEQAFQSGFFSSTTANAAFTPSQFLAGKLSLSFQLRNMTYKRTSQHSICCCLFSWGTWHTRGHHITAYAVVFSAEEHDIQEDITTQHMLLSFQLGNMTYKRTSHHSICCCLFSWGTWHTRGHHNTAYAVVFLDSSCPGLARAVYLHCKWPYECSPTENKYPHVPY